MHSPMRRAWRYAFPYAARMAVCIPVRSTHGDMHSCMRRAWPCAFPYAARMAICIPVCGAHGDMHSRMRPSAYPNARRALADVPIRTAICVSEWPRACGRAGAVDSEEPGRWERWAVAGAWPDWRVFVDRGADAEVFVHTPETLRYCVAVRRAVGGARPVLLVGPAGGGKTTALRCALLPAIAAGARRAALPTAVGAATTAASLQVHSRMRRECGYACAYAASMPICNRVCGERADRHSRMRPRARRWAAGVYIVLYW